MDPDVQLLKAKLPMPELMKRLRLGTYAKPSCHSPFRKDSMPSWGIFQREGSWFFKDLGTGETGDELDLLAQSLELDRDKNFPLLMDLYRAMVESQNGPQSPVPDHTPRVLPDRTGFTTGSQEQVEQLAQLRGLAVPGIQSAQERGVLVFGMWQGIPVFGVTDSSGRVLEIRTLDGFLFPACGTLSERKSHAILGSQKSWPVGIQEARDSERLALVEGVPDFLAAHDLILREQTEQPGAGEEPGCAPVTMLSASVSIAPNALPLFKGKRIIIFPHNDENGAGIQAAARWQNQLESAGANVSLFDFARLNKAARTQIKDMNDFLRVRDEVILRVPAAQSITQGQP